MGTKKSNRFPELDGIHTKILKEQKYKTDERPPVVCNLLLESSSVF